TTWQSFIPLESSPALIPESIEAVPAKVEIIALTAKLICGKINPTADMHPAGRTAIVRGPSTFSTSRIVKLPPQPPQALCPKKSSWSDNVLTDGFDGLTVMVLMRQLQN